MLDFIISCLVGTIIGFFIRGKPNANFAITISKCLAWAVGIGVIGLLIGMPVGVAVTQSTAHASQVAALIGSGIGLGVFHILSIEHETYKKWSDRNALMWLIGGVLGVGVFVLWQSNTTKVSEKTVNVDTSDVFDPDLYLWRQGGVVPTAYCGVTLGVSEQQVRYSLGEPVHIGESGGVVFYHYLGRRLKLSPDNRAVWEISGMEDCPAILGVRIGDDERSVITNLGEKANAQLVELPPQQGYRGAVVKKFTASDKSTALVILLSQGKIYSISLFNEDELQIQKHFYNLHAPNFPSNVKKAYSLARRQIAVGRN